MFSVVFCCVLIFSEYIEKLCKYPVKLKQKPLEIVESRGFEKLQKKDNR